MNKLSRQLVLGKFTVPELCLAARQCTALNFCCLFRRDVPRDTREMRGGDMGASGGPVPDNVSKVPRLDSLNIPARCELVVLDVDGRQR